MKISRIQYTVHPDFVEQNEKNIEAVMSALRTLNVPDLKYATYVLEDGRTFMHLVQRNSSTVDHLPGSLEPFQYFQSQLKDHVEAPPKAESMELVQSSFDIF